MAAALRKGSLGTWSFDNGRYGNEKSRRGRTPAGTLSHRLTLRWTFRLCRSAPRLVFRESDCFSERQRRVDVPLPLGIDKYTWTDAQDKKTLQATDTNFTTTTVTRLQQPFVE